MYQCIDHRLRSSWAVVAVRSLPASCTAYRCGAYKSTTPKHSHIGWLAPFRELNARSSQIYRSYQTPPQHSPIIRSFVSHSAFVPGRILAHMKWRCGCWQTPTLKNPKFIHLNHFSRPLLVSVQMHLCSASDAIMHHNQALSHCLSVCLCPSCVCRESSHAQNSHTRRTAA